MSLIAETSNPLLLQALQGRLQRGGGGEGALGTLEPLALRLGLIQHAMRPRLRDPQLLLCVADHGLAVDGLRSHGPAIEDLLPQLLDGRAPLALLARQGGIPLTLVDCGLSSRPLVHERLLLRKIAHGTRNARVSAAMSVEQAHAAIRAGMEIGDSLPGNAVACAGLGLGSLESAALVIARLADVPVRDLICSGPRMPPDVLAHEQGVLHGALQRHREVIDPVEVLAAFGGFETGVMAGLMLVAASKRQLVLVDGMAACAALMVAARIAPAVVDYCVFCRSSAHEGLDHALQAFKASALMDLGLDTLDGTGACLAWPVIQAAAALLGSADGSDAATTGGLHSGSLGL